MLSLASLIIVIVFSLVLSVTVYLNNPKSITNIAFVIAGVAIIFWSTVMYVSLHVQEYDVLLFTIRFSMLAGSVLTASFLFLAAVFPNEKILFPKWKIIVAAVPTLLSMVIAMTDYMFTSLQIEGGNIEPQPGPGIFFFIIAGVGYIVLTFAIFILKFFKYKGNKKNQIGLVLLGTALMFFCLVTANFIAVVVFKTSSFIVLAPLFTLFFLVSVAYAILRHGLFDLRLFIARTVSYSFLIMFVAILYFSVVYGLFSILPFSLNQTYLSLVVAFVIAFSFGYIKKVIQHATDSVLFKENYNTEELLQTLTQTMASELYIEKLSEKLLVQLSKGIRINKAAFVLVDEKLPLFQAVGFEQKIFTDQFLQDLSIIKQDIILYIDSPEEKVATFFQKHNLDAVFVLKVKETIVGYLLLGQKVSGDIFTNQDIELLKIFAPQAGVALQNAQSYKTIQQFNVTLEKKVEERTEELQAAQKRELKKAKELLKIKDDFVFIATHDLGTPVTAVKGYSSLLQMSKEKFSKDTKENIEALVDASERLDQLTNDLLQVARSDAGTIKINPTELDIIPQITSALSQVKLRAKERHISVEFKPSHKEIMVTADPDKLAEILENLFSNAVKYNKDKGSIEITATKEGKQVTVVVADTGIGIPADLQKKVFSKFFRAQQNGAESVPGTGLGLFVVKTLVEKMGGKINFESTENKGTTFSFTLPLAKV